MDNFILTADGFLNCEKVTNQNFIYNSLGLTSFNKTVILKNDLTINSKMLLKTCVSNSLNVLVKKREVINGILEYKKPEWKSITEVNITDLVGFQINSIHEMPEWDGAIYNRFGKEQLVNKLKDLFYQNDFWWLLGRFFSNGWLRIAERKGVKYPEYKVILYTKNNESNRDSIYNVLMKLKIKFNEVPEATFTKFFIPNKELALFVKQFCENAETKHDKNITKSILNLPVQQLNSFINGCVDFDPYSKNELKEYKIRVKHLSLAYEFGNIFLKLLHKPYQIKKVEKTVFEDEYFEITALKGKGKENFLFENGIVFCPLDGIFKEVNISNSSAIISENGYALNNLLLKA